MGLLSGLFGRSKLKKGDREQFFSIITTADSLRGRTDLRLGEKAGIVFNSGESAFFETLETELRYLLNISGRATGTCFEITDDGYGTRCVVLDDRHFEDLVSTIHMVGEPIGAHGFSDRLIASVFWFDYEGRQAYWVYYIKRGSFHPLVLVGDKQRDNAAEMRLSALMEQEKIPVERDLEKWFALWGIPF